MGNPFRPTFGSTPPLLVGRESIIQDFREGLDDGAGSPYRNMIITGARGSGKTALLNRLEQEAITKGWVKVSVSTRPGMLHDIVSAHLPEKIQEQGGASYKRRLNSVSLGLLGQSSSLGWENVALHRVGPTFRSLLFSLADIMAESGKGVLISIDEVHQEAIEDLRVITQELQHALRETKSVAFVAAGLPESVKDLLNDEVLTFLRRAERHELGSVSPEDVEEALDVPIHESGKTISQDALECAVQGTQGYPYLIQGVGHAMWKSAGDLSNIGLAEAQSGVFEAIRKIGNLVHASALANLSDVDKTFLAAMSVDDGPSTMRDIQDRMKITPQYANTYKQRLIEHSIIRQPTRGKLEFTIPYLRDYLKEHVASLHLGDGKFDGGS